MVRASDGAVLAQYEYGPFGEAVRATGTIARINPIRWSTQFIDDETDFVSYIHRYYDPSVGRWLSRDPVDEPGSAADGNSFKGLTESQMPVSARAANLNLFCRNNGVSFFDVLGLTPEGVKFLAEYPNYGKSAAEVWGLIGGNVGADMAAKNPVPDTCAARVSYALNRVAGEQMKSSPRDYINTVKRGQEGQGGNYVVNAMKMREYLTKHWGTSSDCSQAAAYYFVPKSQPIDELRKEITNILKKCACSSPDYYAIIVYQAPKDANYSGHVAVVTKDYSDHYTPLSGSISATGWILPPTKNPPPPLAPTNNPSRK